MSPRTLEKIKIDKDFDKILANIINKRLKQKDKLDTDKLVLEVKNKVNPRMHRELPDPKI